MIKKRQIMLYFTVASFHFYRKVLVLPERDVEYFSFLESNKHVLEKIQGDANTLFGCELDCDHICDAVTVYLSSAPTTRDTELAKKSQR